MDVELTSIIDAGSLPSERVVLKIGSDTDVGWYAVFACRTGSKPGTAVGADVPKVYWFLNKKVKANDLVVLYTKEGTAGVKKNPDETTSHFVYWGLSSPLWLPGCTPVLVHTPDWQIGESIRSRASA